MTEKRISIALVLLGLVIVFLCYRQNPDLLLYRKDYFSIIDTPPISPSVIYKDLQSNCQATSQYRQDSQRTGVDLVAKPQAQVKIAKKIFPFNVDIHEASKSSPTIDQTGIYIGSDSGWFYKLDYDGEIIWRFYVPGSDYGFHSSAAVDDKKVYIGAYNGFMYALDKSNGELVWANPVANYIGASPLLADGNLFISAETYHPDGLVAKLNCNTGETLWVSEWLGGHSHSSVAFDKANDQVVVGANSGRFYAFDNKTGQTRWNVQVGGQIKGTPLIWDGTAYFGSWDKHYHAYDLKTGKERWKTFMGGRIQTSLTLVPGKAIGVTNTKVGDIIGINLNDGEILWRLRHGDRNHQFSVLVTKDPNQDRFLALSRCKEFQLCTLNAVTGELIENIDLPGSFTSVPSAWEDKIYISLDKNRGLVILQ